MPSDRRCRRYKEIDEGPPKPVRGATPFRDMRGKVTEDKKATTR